MNCRLVTLTVCSSLLALTGALVWFILTLPGRLDPRIQENAAAASWNLRNTTWNLNAASAELANPKTGIARTLRNVNTVTAQIGRTSNIARLASSEQRQYLQQLSQETIATLHSANALIAGADQNLNQGTLPALTASLTEVHNSLVSLTADSHDMLASATGTLGQAGKLLADPSVPLAARNLASASGHLDGTSANIEQATGYLRDMFKPTKQSFWKSLVLSNLPGAILHFLPQRTTVVNQPTVKTEPANQ